MDFYLNNFCNKYSNLVTSSVILDNNAICLKFKTYIDIEVYFAYIDHRFITITGLNFKSIKTNYSQLFSGDSLSMDLLKKLANLINLLFLLTEKDYLLALIEHNTPIYAIK